MARRGDKGAKSQERAGARDRVSGAGGELFVSMPSSETVTPGSAVRPPLGDGEQRVLAEIIETKIIPQLMAMPCEPLVGNTVDADVVKAVSDAAVANEQAVVEQHVVAAAARSGNFSDSMAEIVSRSARQLGVDWENDRRDFFDVTVGLGTLQRVVSRLTEVPGVTLRTDRSVLLGAVPGESHTFGLALICHYFQQGRWPVDFRPFANLVDLKGAIADSWFTVLGLSVAHSDRVSEGRDIIATLRRASLNPSVKVIVGGPALVQNPEFAEAMGADDVALNGREAVAKANAWAEAMPRPRAQ